MEVGLDTESDNTQPVALCSSIHGGKGVTNPEWLQGERSPTTPLDRKEKWTLRVCIGLKRDNVEAPRRSLLG